MTDFIAQLAFTRSKLAIEPLEQDMKFARS